MLEFKDYDFNSGKFGDRVFEQLFCKHTAAISMNYSLIDNNEFISHLFVGPSKSDIAIHILNNIYIFDCRRDVFEGLTNDILNYIKLNKVANEDVIQAFQMFYNTNKPFCINDLHNAISGSFRSHYNVIYKGEQYNSIKISNTFIELSKEHSDSEDEIDLPILNMRYSANDNSNMYPVKIEDTDVFINRFTINDKDRTLELS